MTARLRDLAIRDESGSALAEMAFVVVPLMVLMITGMMFFGIALNNDLALNNAVQAGAEQLALLRGNVADPCASTVTDVQNAAPGLTASSLRYTVTLGGTSYSSSGTTTPSCSQRDHDHRRNRGAYGDLSGDRQRFCFRFSHLHDERYDDGTDPVALRGKGQ